MFFRLCHHCGGLGHSQNWRPKKDQHGEPPQNGKDWGNGSQGYPASSVEAGHPESVEECAKTSIWALGSLDDTSDQTLEPPDPRQSRRAPLCAGTGTTPLQLKTTKSTPSTPQRIGVGGFLLVPNLLERGTECRMLDRPLRQRRDLKGLWGGQCGLNPGHPGCLPRPRKGERAPEKNM